MKMALNAVVYLAVVLPILSTAVLRSSANQLGSVPDLRREDENIVRVVLDRLIFPELAKFGKRDPAAVLLVADQTMSLGSSGTVSDQWQEFLKPNPGVGWPGLIANDARRQRVIESFESRNGRRQDLPVVSRPDLVLVPDGRIREVYERYSVDRPVGIVRFSLPGYSPDGHAMILASYSCGSLCGVSWLIILDNTTGSWRVVNAHVLSIA
jgi:hypothetical protein